MKKLNLFFSLLCISFLISCNEQKETKISNETVEFKDFGANPFVFDIEKHTKENDTYRTAIWTGTHMQMTLMTIQPGEDIGVELHTTTDQFIRVEEGSGIIMMGNTEENLDYQKEIGEDFAAFIPAGKWHNLKNNSDKPLKLYSIYSPAEHPRSTVHKTRAEGLEAVHHH